MAHQPTQASTIDQPEANEAPSEAHGPAESASDDQEEASNSFKVPKQCANCKAPESDPESPLKPCSKCQTVQYCSRDCQKKDWKLHKKTCASAAQIYAQTAKLNPASAPRVPKKEGHRGGLQKWQFDT